MKKATLAWAMLALPLAAAAQTYKWKDSYGRVHFSQVPPAGGIPYETLGGAPPPAAAPNQESLNKALEDERTAAPEREKAQELAAQQQNQQQEACKNAIERLAYLDAQTARRIATRDASGAVSRISEEEFQKQRQSAQADMDKYCGE